MAFHPLGLNRTRLYCLNIQYFPDSDAFRLGPDPPISPVRMENLLDDYPQTAYLGYNDVDQAARYIDHPAYLLSSNEWLHLGNQQRLAFDFGFGRVVSYLDAATQMPIDLHLQDHRLSVYGPGIENGP